MRAAAREVDRAIGAPIGTTQALIYPGEGKRQTKRHAFALMQLLGVPFVTFADLDQSIGALVRQESAVLEETG